MTKIFISTLAINQTKFWIEIVKQLNQKYKVYFISFDEESNNIFKKYCYSYINVYKEMQYINVKDLDIKIDNINMILSHEKIAYGLIDTKKLYKKFQIYYHISKNFIEQNTQKDDKIVILQELGGFISVQSLLTVANKLNIDHYFIEPSFFKGRFFIVRNSNKSINIDFTQDIKVNDEVVQYIKNILNQKSIVIPKKDKFNYQNAINKIFDLYKLRRLFQKLYLKYIKKQNQEFNHILQYLKMIWKMIFNQTCNKIFNNYSLIIPEKFIYIPLHVPNDIALTIRAPEYYNQLALVDFICRTAPLEQKIVIKEHPAMIGMFSSFQFKQLLAKYDNLTILNPNINNFEILDKAETIITINSKTGMEALILNKKVIVLGDAFYDTFEEGIYKTSIHDLPIVMSLLEKKKYDIYKMLSLVYKYTCKGELYDISQQNIQSFSNSINTIIRQYK